ncbi:hypothetical protein [Azospirillum sp. SYSU D00513]|uniref:hypothetical protein n=1 Tax=Azospirillum sp. SYSU D00513 TaxID=2812561 RepID=UPI001A97D355|nr:hypothetical protein [Azospirillum sp. SYSU D00513]
MRKRRVVPFLVLGATAVLLAACAGGPAADMAQQARTSLVGMPKQALLSCAGVPDRQAEAGGREFYSYVQRPTGGYGGPSTSIGIGGGSSSGIGLGLGFGLPLGGGGDSGCEATFTLENGVVRQLVYAPDASLSSCAPIVRNCMPAGAP